MPSKSHLDSSMIATVSIIEIASRGQILTHSPDPRHLSRSTTIFISTAPVNEFAKKEMIYRNLYYYQGQDRLSDLTKPKTVLFF